MGGRQISEEIAVVLLGKAAGVGQLMGCCSRNIAVRHVNIDVRLRKKRKIHAGYPRIRPPMRQQHRLCPPDAAPQIGIRIIQLAVAVVGQPQNFRLGHRQLGIPVLILLQQLPLRRRLLRQIDAHALEICGRLDAGVQPHQLRNGQPVKIRAVHHHVQQQHRGQNPAQPLSRAGQHPPLRFRPAQPPCQQDSQRDGQRQRQHHQALGQGKGQNGHKPSQRHRNRAEYSPGKDLLRQLRDIGQPHIQQRGYDGGKQEQSVTQPAPNPFHAGSPPFRLKNSFLSLYRRNGRLPSPCFFF